MKILTVFGTRPEAIKLAPVIEALRERSLEVVVCVSGQHRDMLDQTLEVFEIQPDYDLDVMKENQSSIEVTARIFEGLAPIFDQVKPDWLLVQGDTTTTLAASWVSFHKGTSIAHVEAGLRTGDKLRPFPEEVNRRLTSVLADLHFAPTHKAFENLLMENIPLERIFHTGNTVVDALLAILRRPVVFDDRRFNNNNLNNLNGRVILVTAHRRESFGKPLKEICRAIFELVSSYSDLTIIFPVHRNPAVRNTVFELLSGHPRILLVDPMPYPQFVHLMKRADLILSDSGGIQEEAPSIGTPVLILREVTERPEVIEAGWAELVGTSCESILFKVDHWIQKPKAAFSSNLSNPFGDGKASLRIAEILMNFQNRM